jgi:nucleotide-binding universal stress UspA family protein
VTPLPVLAAFDPVTRDAAPVRLAAAVAGLTGAPPPVASVLAGDERVDRLAAADGGRRADRRSGPPAPETIGVAYVDTEDGRDALHGAHALADRSDARLRVLTEVQPRPWTLRAATFDDVAGEPRTEAEAAAQAAAGALVGAPVDIDVDVAGPGDLLTAASREVGVRVCASRGYGPRPAALLGGVTRRLVAAAACPVVTARGAAIRLEALAG